MVLLESWSFRSICFSKAGKQKKFSLKMIRRVTFSTFRGFNNKREWGTGFLIYLRRLEILNVFYFDMIFSVSSTLGNYHARF